ncbi:hypothetical protein BDK51DRAFT_18591 [Blyttiomyces helicus]|uniref:Ubiquitin-like protease family profile domain-containing protein n=1 Tax=Blyttiomyces helicus TaxID=388810 RepID=A0A4P9WNT0_9FUNG|nr:hypothetical protein BDK51DRAFT_18591 [Blyttiomyces helicus]|eukprot:RKO92416.1 hypothetical protein BDK51DRAFT_18591 [Blyttiomyces helicus]
MNPFYRTLFLITSCSYAIFSPSSRSKIRITRSEYDRLLPGVFLNDTIMEFYLRYLLTNMLDENLRDEVHMFNSFFFEQLSKDPVDAGLERVKSWTSKVDIFSKSFVFVPINEKKVQS